MPDSVSLSFTSSTTTCLNPFSLIVLLLSRPFHLLHQVIRFFFTCTLIKLNFCPFFYLSSDFRVCFDNQPFFNLLVGNINGFRSDGKSGFLQGVFRFSTVMPETSVTSTSFGKSNPGNTVIAKWSQPSKQIRSTLQSTAIFPFFFGFCFSFSLVLNRVDGCFFIVLIDLMIFYNGNGFCCFMIFFNDKALFF